MAKEKTKSIKGYGLNPSVKGDKIHHSKAMGTNYGVGVKNPQGRVLNLSLDVNPLSKKKLSTPPKSLA